MPNDSNRILDISSAEKLMSEIQKCKDLQGGAKILFKSVISILIDLVSSQEGHGPVILLQGDIYLFSKNNVTDSFHYYEEFIPGEESSLDETQKSFPLEMAGQIQKKMNGPFVFNLKTQSFENLNRSTNPREKIEKTNNESKRNILTALKSHALSTHVMILPLFNPREQVIGFISVDFRYTVTSLQIPLWLNRIKPLQLLVNLMTPFLQGLPNKVIKNEEEDSTLPVVGKRLSALLPLLRIYSEQEEIILITGPSGVGKTRLAEWCHLKSARKNGPFEVIDLMSINEEMQMSELFGWKKGSFTSSVDDYAGAIGRAQKGTLFIDEIDKLSLKTQAGLLQLLDTKKYHAMGDKQSLRSADVRIIIGTNVDLWNNVKEESFREDLYYRINVLPIHLPPLKERKDEIDRWASYMASRRHQEGGSLGHCNLTLEALQLLGLQEWPGNLRQLDNIIRRSYLLSLCESDRLLVDLVIDDNHVQRAIEFDSLSSQSDLINTFQSAASAFVEEAIHRSKTDEPLDLKLADTFRGFVLWQALEQLKDPKYVYQLFGKDQAIKSRNYRREFKRELGKVENFVTYFNANQEFSISNKF